VLVETLAAHLLLHGNAYSNKPFVHFYATKRVGGMVSNSEAIKLLKFSAN
jgi:HK97 family phage major capsid protein